MNEPGTIVGIIAVVLGPLIAWLAGRRKESSAEGRLNHDELQEDLSALRTEFREYKRDIQPQINYQGKVIRHLDDEVIQLRRGVEEGQIPPLPLRPPWPDEVTP